MSNTQVPLPQHLARPLFVSKPRAAPAAVPVVFPPASPASMSASTPTPDIVSRVIEASVLTPAKSVTRHDLLREYVITCLEDPNFDALVGELEKVLEQLGLTKKKTI